MAIGWHYGRTGGFRAWMGLDRTGRHGGRAAEREAMPVDRHGFAMLRELGE
jgi:hypothetical protein